MDTSNQSISNKLFPSGKLEKGYVALILTRKISNPTCTIGELTSEDGVLRLVTKEGKIPKDRMGYIMWCLPPGKYPLEIEYCGITFKDKPIRAYWPVLKKIPWFPRAGFYTGTIMAANKGCIKLGTEQTDDYTITGDDVACQQLVRWSKGIYESMKQEVSDSSVLSDSSQSSVPCDSSQELILEIRQDETTMTFSDLTQSEYEKAEKIAKEKAEQEQLENELYNY